MWFDSYDSPEEDDPGNMDEKELTKRRLMIHLQTIIRTNSLEDFKLAFEEIQIYKREYDPQLDLANLKFPDGSTPLLDCIGCSNFIVAQHLIENRISLNTPNDRPSGFVETPLLRAVRSRKFYLAELLLGCEELDVNISEPGRPSALYYVLMSGNKRIVDLILSHPSLKLYDKREMDSVIELFMFFGSTHSSSVINMYNLGFKCALKYLSKLSLSGFAKFFNHRKPEYEFSLYWGFPLSRLPSLQQLCRYKIRNVFFIKKRIPVTMRNVDANPKTKALKASLKHYLCDLSP